MSRSIFVTIYVKYSFIAMASMMFGSQLVHNRYKPLDDLENYIEKEMEIINASKKLKP